MESILNPAYPHIFEKIFMCLNRDSISNFRLLNHHWKNTLEIVFTKDLARLMLLRKFKGLDDIFSGPEPEFETDIKTPENALFSDEEDDSDDSTIANSKKPKEEFMEIPLEKDSGLCGKYWETPAKRSNSHWWPPNTALSATSASGSKMTTTADDEKNTSFMELAAEIAAQSTPPKQPTSVSGQPAPEKTTSDPQQASNFRQPSPKMSSDVITTTASTSSGPGGEVCTF